ncbi:transmembrane protein 238 like [Amia ocellicauda]|uniref:transmembrane protein 238 like n=1 Tax=Amia ocellicauda TaxID=2972642 RepID=UPI00346475BA
MALRCVGRCFPLFSLGLIFDVIGLTLILVGIFANVQLNGRFFGDFLIYTGAIVIFLSLIWWILWYTGNIDMSPEEQDAPGRRSHFEQWARKLSERLSKGGLKTLEAGEKCIGGKEPKKGHIPTHVATRITWKTADRNGYDNKGFDAVSDLAAHEGKNVELNTLDKSEATLQHLEEAKAERLL